MKWTFTWEPDYETLENLFENMEGLTDMPAEWKLVQSGAMISYKLDPDTGEAWMMFEIDGITKEQADMIEAMLSLVFGISLSMIARGQYSVQRDGKWSPFLYPKAED